MNYYDVLSLENEKLVHNPVMAYSFHSAQKLVEKFFRENLIYDSKVVRVNEISEEEFNKIAYLEE